MKKRAASDAVIGRCEHVRDADPHGASNELGQVAGLTAMTGVRAVEGIRLVPAHGAPCAKKHTSEKTWNIDRKPASRTSAPREAATAPTPSGGTPSNPRTNIGPKGRWTTRLENSRDTANKENPAVEARKTLGV